MLKKLIRGLAVLTGICVTAYLAYFGLGSFLSYYDDLDFDAERWRECHNNPSPKNPRGLMAESLRKRLLRDRLTESEVLILLGRPDCMSAADREKQNLLKYSLGAWGALGLSMDYSCLEIHFDEGGRVKTVLIRE